MFGPDLARERKGAKQDRAARCGETCTFPLAQSERPAHEECRTLAHMHVHAAVMPHHVHDCSRRLCMPHDVHATRRACHMTCMHAPRRAARLFKTPAGAGKPPPSAGADCAAESTADVAATMTKEKKTFATHKKFTPGLFTVLCPHGMVLLAVCCCHMLGSVVARTQQAHVCPRGMVRVWRASVVRLRAWLCNKRGRPQRVCIVYRTRAGAHTCC